MTSTKTKISPLANKGIPAKLREQVEVIMRDSYDYMDNPMFRRKGTEVELFGENEAPLPMTSWYQPTRDDDLLDRTGSPQLMKGEEERKMFLRFNFAKRRIAQVQFAIKRKGLTKTRADEIIEWHRRFVHYREYLVRTNLALVLAMAKRTRLGDVDFAEIVSEGNMALIRAIDKFDIDRGFKFSTYACRAILKAFSRTAMKASKYRTRFPVDFDPELEQSDWVDRRRDMVEEDLTDEVRQIVNRNLAGLSDVEEKVIRRRFNWEQKDESPLTLEEVGAIIGVTKERVRQIQNKALIKIRNVMEDKVLKAREAEAAAAANHPEAVEI